MKNTLFTLVLCLSGTLAGSGMVASGNENSRAALPVPETATIASQVTKVVPPQFPQQMRQAGVSGLVRLDLTVDSQGRVIESKVLEAEYREFAIEALRAVRQWRFTPVKADVPAAHRHIRLPIRFVVAAD